MTLSTLSGKPLKKSEFPEFEKRVQTIRTQKSSAGPALAVAAPLSVETPVIIANTVSGASPSINLVPSVQ